MTPMLPLLVLATLLLAPGAQAQDPADNDPVALAQASAYQAYAGRLPQALAQAGGARELALAALLRQLQAQAGTATTGSAPRPTPADAQVQAWQRDAAARAGQDPVALQLLAASAVGSDEALRLEAARRWQAADPGNLYPLLAAGLDAEALLAAAADATRADSRMYEGVRWVMSAYRQHPPGEREQAALAAGGDGDLDEAAAMAAVGLWAAARPGLAPLFEACDARTLRAVPARRDACLGIARLLADGSDNVADEAAGLSMLQALATGAEERAELAARQRALDWRMLQWGRVARQQPRDGAAQFVRLLGDADITTEQQLVARVLAEAGVPAEPPAGWTPPRR